MPFANECQSRLPLRITGESLSKTHTQTHETPFVEPFLSTYATSQKGRDTTGRAQRTLAGSNENRAKEGKYLHSFSAHSTGPLLSHLVKSRLLFASPSYRHVRHDSSEQEEERQDADDQPRARRPGRHGERNSDARRAGAGAAAGTAAAIARGRARVGRLAVDVAADHLVIAQVGDVVALEGLRRGIHVERACHLLDAGIEVDPMGGKIR